MCQSFEAPQGGLPASNDDCHLEPNLSKRCGCKHCHQSLEPAAAYWGRWAENGLLPLNENDFPKIDQNCRSQDDRGRRNERCRQYYLTEPQHPDEETYRGYLNAYVFADAEREAKIIEGPAGIADEAINTGAFARCTAKNLWSKLVSENRDLSDAVMVGLGESFAKDYDLLGLIEAIVQRPEYVKAGHF